MLPIHNRQSTRLKGYDYSKAGLYFVTICCEDRICRFGTIENGKMILNEYGIIAYNEWAKLPERFPNFELDVFQIMPNHMHGIIVLNDVGATLAVAPNIPNKKPVGAGFTPALNDGNINVQPQIDVQSQMEGQPQIDGQPQTNVQPQIEGQPKIEGQPQGLPLPPNTVDNNNRAGASPAPTTVGNIIGAYKSLVANACLDIYKMKNKTMGKLWQRNYHDHIIRNEQSYQTISNYIISNPAKWNDDKFFRA